ncbi:MAG: HU family DNA-binding protein [Deltaproteobacteria bacterium]|nr:HU family DNA-binding protein [Deltaproteobacteria bacterium]
MKTAKPAAKATKAAKPAKAAKATKAAKPTKAAKTAKPTKTAKPVKKTAAKATKATAKATAKTATKTAAPAAPKKAAPTPPKKAVLVTPKNGATKQYTQSEFFECVKDSCGFISRRDAKLFYANFADMLQSALKSGYKVVMPGLGKIQVRKTKARMGRNPATQEPMMIPARRKVAFTALKALKDAVL